MLVNQALLPFRAGVEDTREDLVGFTTATFAFLQANWLASCRRNAAPGTARFHSCAKRFPAGADVEKTFPGGACFLHLGVRRDSNTIFTRLNSYPSVLYMWTPEPCLCRDVDTVTLSRTACSEEPLS